MTDRQRSAASEQNCSLKTVIYGAIDDRNAGRHRCFRLNLRQPMASALLVEVNGHFGA
jgi:hypothetical protein